MVLPQSGVSVVTTPAAGAHGSDDYPARLTQCGHKDSLHTYGWLTEVAPATHDFSPAD
jgi:hypothetical protein